MQPVTDFITMMWQAEDYGYSLVVVEPQYATLEDWGFSYEYEIALRDLQVAIPDPPKRTGRRTSLPKKQLVEPEDEVTTDLRLQRPQTREDCVNGQRPCPWVSCKWNLYLDVGKNGKTIYLTNTNLQPEEMDYSCALDICDRGSQTYDTVARYFHTTRARVQQIEKEAAAKLKEKDVRSLLEMARHLREVRENENDSFIC
jgi:hypothetical protein